jgi:hypothetical protein
MQDELLMNVNGKRDDGYAMAHNPQTGNTGLIPHAFVEQLDVDNFPPQASSSSRPVQPHSRLSYSGANRVNYPFSFIYFLFVCLFVFFPFFSWYFCFLSGRHHIS